MTEEHDYLAIIPIGAGSTFGRGRDKEKAIRTALAHLRDWDSLYNTSEIQVTINVVDIHGYGDCDWGFDGLQGVNEATGKYEPIQRPVEHIKRVTPKLRRRA